MANVSQHLFCQLTFLGIDSITCLKHDRSIHRVQLNRFVLTFLYPASDVYLLLVHSLSRVRLRAVLETEYENPLQKTIGLVRTCR